MKFFRVTIEVVEDREYFVVADDPEAAKKKALELLTEGVEAHSWEWVKDTVRDVEEWEEGKKP